MQLKLNSQRQKQVMAEAVALRVCPLTAGRPTVFYGDRAKWDRCCQKKQEEMRRVVQDGFRIVRMPAPGGRCGVCLGKQLPDELEIKPIGGGNMAMQSCEVCGKQRALRSVRGKMACTNCRKIFSDVSNRAESVVQVIRLMRPDLLGQAVQDSGVTAQVESRALAEIAKAVGFSGDNGEALIASVAQVVIERDEARERLLSSGSVADDVLLDILGLERGYPVKEAVETMVQSRDSAWAKVREYGERLKAAEDLIEKHSLPDVTRALDCAAHDWDMAAIHTAALLDEAVRQRIQDHAQMGALGHAADRMRELIEALRADLARIKEEYTMTIDRMTDLEQIQVVSEQIFARLREILGSDGLDNCDIVGAVSVLVEALRGATRHRNGGQTALDGHLLDLVLEYPGIPLERIAMIREAV